jgi:hypothetical protein
MRLAVLRRDEVERALAQVGFSVEAVYGSYELTPYEDGAPRILYVARPV